MKILSNVENAMQKRGGATAAAGVIFRMLSGLAFVAAFAMSQAWASTADEAAVAARMKEKYPRMTLSESPSRVESTGLYEMQIAGQAAYTDAQASFLLVGGELLIGSGDQVKNYTQTSQMKAQEGVFKTLPLEEAFRTVYGKGEQKLAVFSDPDCPFCQRFEATLEEHKKDLNLTVYTFLWPLSIHQHAAEHAAYLWCTKDRSSAFRDWMLFSNQAGIAPGAWERWLQKTNRPAANSCDHPAHLEKINAIAASQGFMATPTLLFENGMTYPGAATYDKLLQALEYVRKHTLKDLLKK